MGPTIQSEIKDGVRRVQFVRRLRGRVLLGWLAACVPACMALYIFVGEGAAGWILALYVAAAVGVVVWEARLACPRCGWPLERIRRLLGLDRESEKACRHCSLSLVE